MSELYNKLKERFPIQEVRLSNEERAEEIRKRMIEVYGGNFGYHLHKYHEREDNYCLKAYNIMTSEEILMTENRVLESMHKETERFVNQMMRFKRESEKSTRMICDDNSPKYRLRVA